MLIMIFNDPKRNVIKVIYVLLKWKLYFLVNDGIT